MSVYAARLRRMICEAVGKNETDKPLEGYKIVVDAGNGAGGFYASKVLEPLGADISSSQFLEPDGNFPNHAPNPEDKKAMAAICSRVKECGTDLGLIFDTDLDRSSAVDERGNEINRNSIVAMAAALIADAYPGTTVVTDSITSNELTTFLEEGLGLKHLRFKRGYKNVINKSVELNESGIDSQLAIETSGHAAYKENYFLDDGAYMAVKLLIAAALAAKEGKQVGSFIEKLAKGFDERERRMKIFAEDFASYGKEVLAAFESRAKEAGYNVAPNSYEGVRLSFNSEEVQGWLLLRMSLHDPLMPMNLEGVRPGDCEKMLAIVKELLVGFDQLDI